MSTLNLRAFKVVFPGGKFEFELKKKDERGGRCGICSIKELAKATKDEAEKFLLTHEDELTNVSIDLKPFHEIEWPSDLSPRRCLPLSKEEEHEFWRHFIS